MVDPLFLAAVSVLSMRSVKCCFSLDFPTIRGEVHDKSSPGDELFSLSYSSHDFDLFPYKLHFLEMAVFLVS